MREAARSRQEPRAWQKRRCRNLKRPAHAPTMTMCGLAGLSALSSSAAARRRGMAALSGAAETSEAAAAHASARRGSMSVCSVAGKGGGGNGGAGGRATSERGEGASAAARLEAQPRSRPASHGRTKPPAQQTRSPACTYRSLGRRRSRSCVWRSFKNDVQLIKCAGSSWPGRRTSGQLRRSCAQRGCALRHWQARTLSA